MSLIHYEQIHHYLTLQNVAIVPKKEEETFA